MEPHPAEIGQLEQSLLASSERGLQLRSAQRSALDRARWVDRDAGIVAIPIERAMDITAERAR